MISESQTLILHGYLKTFLFIYLAVLGLHCCACAFSSCGKRRLLSSGGAWASHCSGFPYCRACVLGAGALLPLGIWNLPGPGIKPMFPELAGRFLSTGPPGKFQGSCFKTSSPSPGLLFPPVSWCFQAFFNAVVHFGKPCCPLTFLALPLISEL